MAFKLDARKKRAALVVAIVVPVLFAVLGVPALLSKASDPIAGVDDVERGPSAALQQVAGVRQETPSEDPGAADATGSADDPAPTASGREGQRLAPTVDGDLHVALELALGTPRVDSTIRAEVTLANLSLEEFHVPAPGGPQPTLSVVVVDDEGNEVRRIVESTDDGLPRRMRLLRSGDLVELDVWIVADGEEGLTAGAYRAYAEFASDPAWQLIGIPCYVERAVPPRSEWIAFDVVE